MLVLRDASIVLLFTFGDLVVGWVPAGRCAEAGLVGAEYG